VPVFWARLIKFRSWVTEKSRRLPLRAILGYQKTYIFLFLLRCNALLLEN
jgi:hypothetical protein